MTWQSASFIVQNLQLLGSFNTYKLLAQISSQRSSFLTTFVTSSISVQWNAQETGKKRSLTSTGFPMKHGRSQAQKIQCHLLTRCTKQYLTNHTHGNNFHCGAFNFSHYLLISDFNENSRSREFSTRVSSIFSRSTTRNDFLKSRFGLETRE